MPASSTRARMGLGTRIIWTVSQFSGEIIDTIEGLGADRTDFDATHMGVPALEQGDFGNMLKVPSDLAMIQDMTFSMHLDSAGAIPPVGEDPETIELLFRRRKTELIGAKFSACGYLKNFTWTIPVQGKMTMRVVVGFTGNAQYVKPVLVAA